MVPRLPTLVLMLACANQVAPLIVLSDGASGFWAFKLDGFDGWNGHQWGIPDISSAQDWDNGPEGAPKPQKAALR